MMIPTDTRSIPLMKPKSTSCLPFVMLPERPLSPPIRRTGQQESLCQPTPSKPAESPNRIRHQPVGDQLSCQIGDPVFPTPVSQETNTDLHRFVNRSAGDISE